VRRNFSGCGVDRFGISRNNRSFQESGPVAGHPKCSLAKEQGRPTVEELLVGTVLDSWKMVIGRLDRVVATLTDEQLERQIAPGKNRVRYLIGHLTAVNDRMLPMLSLGERLHPELDDAYITHPDQEVADPLSIADLKKAWADVNAALTQAFAALTPAEWLAKHTAVSDEDFAANPLRNRLAVLLSRTNHASYHAGQAVLIR
jgi:uncharacterized damage-inducible protein DinB